MGYKKNFGYYFIDEFGVDEFDIDRIDVEKFTSLAEKGNSNAQYIIGRYYSNFHNYEKAIPWIIKSAEQGNELAQCKLGSMYKYGDGFKCDYKEAEKWYNLSAETGLEEAQYEMGQICESKGDFKKAAEWYNKAIGQNFDNKYIRKLREIGEKLK